VNLKESREMLDFAFFFFFSLFISRHFFFFFFFFFFFPPFFFFVFCFFGETFTVPKVVMSIKEGLSNGSMDEWMDVWNGIDACM